MSDEYYLYFKSNNPHDPVQYLYGDTKYWWIGDYSCDKQPALLTLSEAETIRDMILESGLKEPWTIRIKFCGKSAREKTMEPEEAKRIADELNSLK